MKIDCAVCTFRFLLIAKLFLSVSVLPVSGRGELFGIGRFFKQLPGVVCIAGKEPTETPCREDAEGSGHGYLPDRKTKRRAKVSTPLNYEAAGLCREYVISTDESKRGTHVAVDVW